MGQWPTVATKALVQVLWSSIVVPLEIQIWLMLNDVYLLPMDIEDPSDIAGV